MHTRATPRHQGKRAVPLLCWLVIETRFGVNFGCIFREFCAWDRVASRWCDQTYQKIMSVVKAQYAKPRARSATTRSLSRSPSRAVVMNWFSELSSAGWLSSVGWSRAGLAASSA